MGRPQNKPEGLLQLQTIESVTPEWLTRILKANGSLVEGEVAQIEEDDKTYNQGQVADITRLAIQYTQSATGLLPTNLLLKQPKWNLHPELRNRSSHEAKFYAAIAELGVRLPLPTCYSVAYNETAQTSHILMADLSATHFQRPLPIPPSQAHCKLIVESLAQVHAIWWNSSKLGTEIGERLTADAATAINQRLVATLPSFFDFFGDALLVTQRQAIEKIVESDFLTRLSARLCELRNVTLIHGDAHTGNLLLPRDATVDGVILIDWQLWAINVAAIDLAFLMALHWSPQRRAELEKPLLQHYHKQLLANGVNGYLWDELWHDYRESVMIMSLIPIGQFRRKSPIGVVWFGLESALVAFEDLHCAELL